MSGGQASRWVTSIVVSAAQKWPSVFLITSSYTDDPNGLMKLMRRDMICLSRSSELGIGIQPRVSSSVGISPLHFLTSRGLLTQPNKSCLRSARDRSEERRVGKECR